MEHERCLGNKSQKTPFRPATENSLGHGVETLAFAILVRYVLDEMPVLAPCASLGAAGECNFRIESA